MSFIVEQERDRPRTGSGALGAVGAVGLVVGVVAVGVAAHLSGGRPAPPPEAPPAGGGALLNEAERRSLERWGWVDRDAGLAVVPVERAMDWLASHPEERPR
jgi:hypothetical protein